MPDAVPACCEVERGTSPVLLIAPHGGRRPPIDPCAPPANLRVNDVYTPEVTRALGKRLGAGWIINQSLDRNDLDLNRLSQVRRRAPWFLDLLGREIAFLLELHGRVEILFVHGWNNGQVKCDIGLGACERDGVLAVPPDGRLTVSGGYLAGRVRSLRYAFKSEGIAAPLGEKYPASHANNLVQIFAREGDMADEAVARLAGLAARGRIEALQLELTLPLRCPGTWRERLLEAVERAFRDPPYAAVTSAPLAAYAPGEGTAQHDRPESIQFYDPAADLGVFAGVARMGPHSTGGRLLLFLGGQRIALFTGEEVGANHVPPLRLERSGKTLRLRFSGPILVMDDAAEYLDLEAALAASRAFEADLAVDFEENARAGSGATFGSVEGEICIDGRRRWLATEGFGHVAGLRAAGSGQTMLAASFGSRRGFAGRLAGEASAAVHFQPDGAEVLHDLRLTVIEDGDAYTPAAFELHARDLPPLHAEALSRMAILRGGPHGYVRVAFGVARFDWDGLAGYGLYEHALPLPLRPA